MSEVRVNGVRLVCDDTGSGPAVLLLHGFTGTAATWTKQLVSFGRHHRTIAVDLLGHGRSDAVVDADRYGLDRQAADLAALLGALEIPTAAVVGYSMGARIALRLAVDRPRVVETLVLESPSSGIADALARQERITQDERMAADLERDGIEAFSDMWERQPLFASRAAMTPEDRDELRRERTSHDAHALAAALRGGGQGAMEPMTRALGSISVPSLVIAGALDEAGLARARIVADAIPAADLEVFDAAGHTPHLEDADRFTALVSAFLDTTRQPN